MGIPGGSESKESACNVGDMGLVLGLGRSSGGGHSNSPLTNCYLSDVVQNQVSISCSVVSDSAIPRTVAHQAPLSMGIAQTRIMEWVASCWLVPPPGNLPNPGIKPLSPTWQADSFPLKVKVAQLCPTLATLWTIQSMEFSRSEYWSG